MNVSRRLPDGNVNPKEVNQQVICMTSAGTKSSFAYERLIDTFENAIIELAKLVKEYYGDEYIWNDDDEPKF